MTEGSGQTARITATVSQEFKQELEESAARFNLPLSSYLAMVATIGHKAFTKGRRVIYEEANIVANS